MSQMWDKKGHIYSPTGLLPWAQTHAQMPTSYLTNDGQIGILFASRDSKNISRIGSIIVSSKDPGKLIHDYKIISLDIGTKGCFDDSGVMPSSLVRVDSIFYLYYIGWNERSTVSYHNSIGLATSDDGINFKRMYDGPIMERTYKEPYFCSAPCVIYDEGIWRMWYLSCTEWIYVNEKIEPRYHIKYADSLDGIVWNRQGRIAIDYKNDSEGGIVRPSVIKKKDGGYQMWFSFRNTKGYRLDTFSSYRIGYAESFDALSWDRQDNNSGISVSNSGWDSFMIAYPDVLICKNKIYMFYNGNGFGYTGLGYAVLEA